MDSTTRRKKVLCPLKRGEKTYWMRIGSAFINSDGSTNVYLDAFPSNNKLQIRDLDERDLQPRRRDDDGGALHGDDTPF
ncbi:MAG TPA: hypothetical protein VKZ63_08165 [Kofleriaceae bacterium]|nr:hypothetical protein [Kofleriaceae bacterium]